MIDLFRILVLVRLCGAAIAVCLFGSSAAAQLPQPQGTTQAPRSIPIEHYYWYFLKHQAMLDQLAAEREAKGQDGSWMRKHLQVSLGFSDADYARVRLSSQRLGNEVKNLDTQAAAIKAAGISPVTHSQLNSLTTQRDAAIHAEVSSLRADLSPQSILALEAFMVQFFSPAKLILERPPSSDGGSSKAVQP